MTKKQEREYLYQQMNGRCGYCGTPLPERWHVDHMDAVVRKFDWCKTKRKFVQNGEMFEPQNDVLENKIASCPSCNIRKRSDNVEQFREQLQHTMNTLNENSAYKFARRFGLITETGAVVKFYFEIKKDHPIKDGL